MSGEREQREKELNQAIKQLVAKIDQQPEDWRLYNDLAIHLTQLRDYLQAEELAMKSLGRFEHDKEAQQTLLYTLGNIYYSAEEYDKAVTYFDQIADQKLKRDALVMIAQSLMQQQDYQHALVYALTAHDQMKQDPEVNTLLGDLLLALGEFQQASDFYDDALQSDAKFVRALFGRGLIALVNDQDASAYFAKVQELDAQFYQANQQRVDEIATVITQKNAGKTQN